MTEGGGRFVPPRGGWLGRLQTRLGNAPGWARLRRRTLARLPFPTLMSDVTDVLYATWSVPAAAARALVPAGVELAERDGQVLLTVLSYRHGHFGPALAGPLLRLFPSPLQSNWRFYVDRLHGTAPAEPTVLFVANVFDGALYALGTRLLSDVLPSRLAGRFTLLWEGEAVTVDIAGPGSAPTLTLTARHAPGALPPLLAPLFEDWTAAVTARTMQEAALAAVPDIDALALARIDLPIPLAEVVPLVPVSFRPGALLIALGATEPPFCFLVPRVPFRVLSERLVPASRTF